ncbi:MAG TPA: glycerophosphodiester phosphodiesterase family protein [Gemmataceae bacterium]|nr:glycerophosphodiester phosphodiesterase family protein [Gemmataceae bacterium]
MSIRFNLQGHRGARALHPENTLPSFEAALDAGVCSIETDVHLTGDGVAVLCHDPILCDPPCTLLRLGSAASAAPPMLSCLSLADLRGYRADGNPDPRRFPDQSAAVTPLAAWFAQQHGLHPYGIPTLAELLQFTAAYAGEPGMRAGKSQQQRKRAETVGFDLELKRVPFHPETINDRYDGTMPGLLEEAIVEAVRRAGVVARTTVRSFDHRCVRMLRQMEPGLTGAVLVAETALIAPAELVERADAQIYCPTYLFLDAAIVRQVRKAGARVLPWTVNEPEHWRRLLDWGVDGITTDVPDRLARYLGERGIAF